MTMPRPLDQEGFKSENFSFHHVHLSAKGVECDGGRSAASQSVGAEPWMILAWMYTKIELEVFCQKTTLWD